jgi:hypothetical protein
MKYRKKPVVVEAIQYKSSSTLSFGNCYNNIDDIKKFTNGSIKLKNYMSFYKGIQADDEETILPERYVQVTIPTLEGDMLVSEGDYIIKNENGEICTCKPDIFHKTYEKVQ